jgi:hypothetical protein
VFVNRSAKSLNTTAQTVISDIRKHKLRNQGLHSLDTEIDLNLHISKILSSSCPPLELRTHAFQLLKSLYLPREQPDDGYYYSQTCYGWLIAASGLKGASQALDISLFSFCVVVLHVSGSNVVSLERSLDLYNTALQKLRADIEDPEKKLREETLAAIVIISTIEVRNLEIVMSVYCLTGNPSYS